MFNDLRIKIKKGNIKFFTHPLTPVCFTRTHKTNEEDFHNRSLKSDIRCQRFPKFKLFSNFHTTYKSSLQSHRIVRKDSHILLTEYSCILSQITTKLLFLPVNPLHKSNAS